MKAQQAINLLQELKPDTDVYCLIYIPEDAELYTEEQNVSQLLPGEWANVVRGMEVNDGIDTEAYHLFNDLIEKQLAKRGNTDAN